MIAQSTWFNEVSIHWVKCFRHWTGCWGYKDIHRIQSGHKKRHVNKFLTTVYMCKGVCECQSFCPGMIKES